MPPPSIESYVQDSHFIVAGSIERLGETTTSIIPAVPSVGIFKIEEILYGPRVLAGFAGRDITVAFNELDGIRPGDRFVLFATSWLYGESLAVREVGKIKDLERAEMRKKIERAHAKAADKRLQERLKQAELVIVGEVSKTRPPPGEEGHVIFTEHDPDWWEALIDVESTLKGDAGGEVTILFPRSVDIAWSQSPKFEPGDDGIWILQRDQTERGSPRLRRPGLTALDPLDFQSRGELRRIRRLTPKRRSQ
jgi:hypothetical protein